MMRFIKNFLKGFKDYSGYVWYDEHGGYHMTARPPGRIRFAWAYARNAERLI